jgi:hypothetical protein
MKRVDESDFARWLADVESQHKHNSFFYSINRNIVCASND